MKGRRHTPEEKFVRRKLREADWLLARAATSMWLPALGGVGADLSALAQPVQGDATGGKRLVRLKQLEKENARLKRIVGEQALDIDMLWEASGSF